MSENIFIRKSGYTGRITLNRPDVLNSLTYPMILAIEKALNDWETDESIAFVIIDGEGDRDVPTYGIEAIECYPETVSAIEYNYGSSNQIVRVTVGFQYKQWHNLATDKIAGMTFGQSTQTHHDIKQPDRGLIGKLPPDLQRAGREVFNSAKRQVPIGRLFKGKLFPPFF